IELRNYSQIVGSVHLVEFQIPPCGLSEGSYTGRIFFSLEMIDSDSYDNKIDSVKIVYKKITQESFLKFLIKDTQLTEEIINSYNIISVGGPGYTKTEKGTNICNVWTKTLVDRELSEVDWYNSEGEWEYIEDNGVLIVAGKDREATRQAAEKLVENL
ncbi:MAG: S-layer protein, partial [Methanomicrobia archaeon]|nr:S-layer protein [Methanomicrobia archaeon]